MNPFFDQVVIPASDVRTLAPCSAIRFKSVTGTVKVTFGNGSEITVTTGDVFQATFPQMFKRVKIETSAASTATVTYGNGSFSSGGSSSSAGGGVQPTTGSPEGVLAASDGQWAFDSSDGSLYVNINTSGTTGWVQLLG